MRAFSLLSALAALAAFTFTSACQDAPDPAGPAEPEPQLSRSVAQGGTGTASAMVQFGDHEAGSPFPPAEHDRSFHAKDKMVPRTVTIDRDGSVTFEIGPLHQVAIFEPGTEPSDIDATQTEPVGILPPPLERITFDDGQVARSPGPTTSHMDWTTPAGTFEQAGRYLVICTINLHFLEAEMYGWIIVR